MKNFHKLLLVAAFFYCQIGQAANYIYPLLKKTVGPYDNYQGVYSADDTKLYYTKTVKQVPNLHLQEKDSVPKPLFDDRSDSKDPATHPTKDWLAFTYFKFDASGDICILKNSDEIECRKRPSSIEKKAFWVGQDYIGFLKRSNFDREWSLIVENVDSKKEKIIDSGLIGSASASRDGKFLIYSKRAEKNQISIYDRRSSKNIRAIDIDLPGVMGELSFSQDTSKIFFTQFLADTNKDGHIDGNDHGVIYSVDFRNNSSYPRQLSSISDNCNFPRARKFKLTITCSAEGTLDIFEIPLGGQVPDDWSKNEFKQALKAARRYSDRMLILSNYQLRFPQSEVAYYEQLFSSYLLNSSYVAAIYYGEKLEKKLLDTKEPRLAELYEALVEWVKVKSKYQTEDKDSLSAAFLEQLDKSKAIIKFQNSWPVLKKASLSWLYLYEGDEKKASRQLAKVKVSNISHPWEMHLIYLLNKRLYGANNYRLSKLYSSVVTSSFYNEDVQLYYGVNFLRYLSVTQSATKKKSAMLDIMDKTAPKSAVYKLFSAELDAMSFDGASYEKLTKREKRAKLRSLRTKLSSYKKVSSNLVRISFTRLLEYFSSSKNQKMITQMSRAWLGAIKQNQIEYPFAVEQLIVNEENDAYELIYENKEKNAIQMFYYLIRKDDFYSGWAGVAELAYEDEASRLKFAQKKISTLKNSTKDGRRYGEVLMSVYAEQLEGADIKDIDEKISKLEALRGYSEDDALRYLLIGYLYQMKMELSKDSYKFSRKDFEKAHRNYMICLDMLHTNARARASVLENLAWLHFDAMNYSFSSELFLARGKLPFSSNNSEAQFYWAAARASYFSGLKDEAVTQMKKALTLLPSNSKYESMFRENLSFYKMNAEQYEGAVEGYEAFYALKPSISSENSIRIGLSYALSLAKLGRKAEAKERLNSLTSELKKLKSQAIKKSQKLAFEPLRFESLLWGLSAEFDPDAKKKIMYLNLRLNALEASKEKVDILRTSQKDLLMAKIQDYQRIARAYDSLENHERAAETLMAGLKEGKSFAEENNSYKGPLVYSALVNWFSHGILYPKSHRNLSRHLVVEMMEKAEQAWQTILKDDQVEEIRRAKLMAYKTAYNYEVYKQGSIKDVSPDRVIGKNKLEAIKKVYPRQLNEYIETYKGLENYLTKLTSSN